MSESDFVDTMMAVFARRGTDGEPLFTRDDIRHVVPRLVLRSQVQPQTLPQPILDCVIAMLDAAGVKAETPAARAIENVDAYCARRPVNAELELALAQTLRAWNATKIDTATAGKRYSAFLGQAHTRRDEPDTEPPEGSVRAGPWARFELKK